MENEDVFVVVKKQVRGREPPHSKILENSSKDLVSSFS